MRRRVQAIGGLFSLGLLLLLPLEAGPYVTRLATIIYMWAGLAGSWNLMAGYTGAVDLGPVVYYGIGAFATAAFMVKGQVPFLLALLLAGPLAVAVAFAVGTPTLRLRGAYFAVGTLALAEAAKQLGLSWDRLTGIPLTGGSAGVTLPLSRGYLLFYYVMLGIMVLVTGTALWLDRSKFGYGLRAIRANDLLAEASGVDLFRAKRSIYMVSALFIGWTGGTAGYWLSYVNANEAFSASITFQMVVMALLGGLGTPLGPVVGAGFLTLASEFLGTRFIYYYLIAIGVLIVGISLFFPAGLMGWVGGVRKGRETAVRWLS